MDIINYIPKSGGIPYTGATSDVNLGVHNFVTTGTLGAGATTLTGDLTVGSTTAGKNISANATLGSELCPSFDPANWTATNGWAANGAGTTITRVNNASNGTCIPSGVGATPIAGVTYKIVITASVGGSGATGFTYGSVPKYAFSATSAQQIVAGTTTYYVTAYSTEKFTLYGNATYTCTINSISIIPLTSNTGDVSIGGNLQLASPVQTLAGVDSYVIDPDGRLRVKSGKFTVGAQLSGYDICFNGYVYIDRMDLGPHTLYLTPTYALELDYNGGLASGIKTSGNLHNDFLIYTNGVNQWTVTSTGALVAGFDGTGAQAITTTGAISGGSLALTTDLTVPNGGTGLSSVTAYMPIVGGTTTTGALQSVATGTQSYPLVYNGTGSLPTFTLLPVAGGGSGRATETAYCLIAAGTTTTNAQVSIANSATVGAALLGAGTSAVPAYNTGVVYASTILNVTGTVKSTSTTTFQSQGLYDANNYWSLQSDSAGVITFGVSAAATTGDILIKPKGSGTPALLSDMGSMILGGNGLTNNEKITLDFETNANVVGVSSTTGVTQFALTSIDLNMPANDWITDTTTGSMFATATAQKLAFHGATPVIQRANAAQAQVATTGSTLVTPYGYTTSAQADGIVALLNEIQAVLVEKGIMKGSA